MCGVRCWCLDTAQNTLHVPAFHRGALPRPPGSPQLLASAASTAGKAEAQITQRAATHAARVAQHTSTLHNWRIRSPGQAAPRGSLGLAATRRALGCPPQCTQWPMRAFTVWKTRWCECVVPAVCARARVCAARVASWVGLSANWLVKAGRSLKASHGQP